MTPTKAKANPTKAFFVRMITRDISLTDCILDLIDNSVDGAWQMEGSRPMSLSTTTSLSKYKIEIEADASHFRIGDNCGGISLDQAAEYAFTFGRKDSDPHEKYSIGVYGIGMKRAVFKMGREIRIRSTYKNNKGKTEAFAVPIQVTKWVADEAANWDFDIDSDEPLQAPGVEVSVKDLTDDTSTAFGSPAFLQNLRRTIARDYALHLHRGLVIRLNGKDIDGWQIEMRQSRQFIPMRKSYKARIGKGSVNIEILAGMIVPPPETSEPDEQDDGEVRSGWYVACNGRIVLAADKSIISGWGTDDWPKWHPQYAGFIGLVLFSAENASLLPLTTTKRSVDISSAAYRGIMPYMREVSKQWIAYTNVRKQALEQAKNFESKAKSVSLFSIKRQNVMALPTLTPKPKKKMANISYAMPIERVRALGNGFGDINKPNREVGIASFEHAYSDLVGED